MCINYTILHIYGAVSYTHLDVYKRQVKDGDTILFKASRGMKFEELLAPVYERWSK